MPRKCAAAVITVMPHLCMDVYADSKKKLKKPTMQIYTKTREALYKTRASKVTIDVQLQTGKTT